MSIGAYARASLVVIVALVSSAFAGSDPDFDPNFPDGTILPATLSFPNSEPFFPEVDIPSPPPSVVNQVKPSQPRPAQKTAAAPSPAKPAVAPRPASQAKVAQRPASTRQTLSQRAILTLAVRSTAYNSLSSQTDRTPHVTATGARTRFGIIAVSRDLLRTIPYGSRVRLEDMGSWSGGGRGKYNEMLSNMVFVVEDTMNPRKSGTVDVWFPARRQAIQWGVRRLRLTVLQLGR